MMDRNALLSALQLYKTSFAEERVFIPRFKSLLTNFENCYKRTLFSGHMTGSAWIVDRKGQAALLVHHKKLNRWLQPGGHADGEENIMYVASKEAEEETGLKSLKLHSPKIFDIDIHVIPARKNVVAHFHHDIRFLFVADHQEDYVVSDESNELSWISLKNIRNYAAENISIHRMASKTISIFN